MIFSKEQLHPSSRVWIYQANRKLTAEEIAFLQSFLAKEIDEWSAHGAALKAGFEICFDQIVCIFADESQHAASGCSIDSSTRWFKDLGAKFGIDFFDRSAAIVQENELQLIPFLEIKKAIENGVINLDSLIATPQVSNLDAYSNQWPEKASDSWLKRYFKQAMV
jgi:hypothetical protein